MKNNEKKGFPYTLIIVILLVVITYFFTPKNFWDNVGSNSASSPKKNVGTSNSLPTNLRFMDPFEHDNSNESGLRDAFIKDKSDKEKKRLFFK